MSDQDAKVTTAAEIKQRSQSPNQEQRKGGALATLSGQVGNDEIFQRLAAGNESRDDLLDFIMQRLGNMRDSQLAEIELCKITDNSMRTTLGDSRNRHEKPDPKRWVQAANLYQDAARALCSGQLHRGNSLLDQAVVEDRKANDNLSKFVKDETAQAEVPAVNLSSDIACTDCPEPDGLGIADDIQAVTTEGNMNIKGQRRELDPWWTDLEEDEEEEEAAQ